jgi:hypothetical protein
MMESGNADIFDGELSALYKLMKQILDDIKAVAEGKHSQSALRENLHCGRVIDLGVQDESISDVTVSSGWTSKRRKIEIYKEILEQLDRRGVLSAAADREEQTELIMTEYCAKKGIDVNLLMETSRQSVEARAILTDLGLDTILNIYCSRGMQFKAGYFKDQMKDLNIPPLDYHILYCNLEELRRTAVNESKIVT